MLVFFHLDITKNLKYDRLTNIIMKRVIKSNSNCIDVGCHKGEMLALMMKYSPNGKHFAFEPIPYLFEKLQTNFGTKANLYSCALSDKNGESTFQLVKNAPAYSGLNKRRYDTSSPDIEEIKVKLGVLDEIIPSYLNIDFIKIDVEGGEFGVLKGAKQLLKKNKPVIVFECGMGASDYYGTTANDLYNYLVSEIGLNIYTLSGYLKTNEFLTNKQFEHYFITNEEYYFIASK